MPTAGRLAGAVAFVILGVYLAYIAMPRFDEGTVPVWWLPLAGAAGIWTGWVVVGTRTGNGWAAGIGNGITGVVALVFWIMFFYSFFEMIKKSMRNSYDGPMDAVMNVFELMYRNAIQLFSIEMGISIVVGGLIAGLFSEFFGKRYT